MSSHASLLSSHANNAAIRDSKSMDEFWVSKQTTKKNSWERTAIVIRKIIRVGS
jgi:hypothetical protein